MYYLSTWGPCKTVSRTSVSTEGLSVFLKHDRTPLQGVVASEAILSAATEVL
jgi:hypothetical protein